MTIDDAIERYTNNAEYQRTQDIDGYFTFKQLATWLTELKKVSEALSYICNTESCSYDFDEARDIADRIVREGE